MLQPPLDGSKKRGVEGGAEGAQMQASTGEGVSVIAEARVSLPQERGDAGTWRGGKQTEDVCRADGKNTCGK